MFLNILAKSTLDRGMMMYFGHINLDDMFVIMPQK